MSQINVNQIFDANGTSKVLVNGALNTPLGTRNKIINGAMTIDQRSNGGAVTYNNGGSEAWFLDRWKGNSTGTTRFSVQRSTVAPAGFRYSTLITTTTAGVPASGDFCYFGQAIEGFNVAEFDMGLSTAKVVTLSFWVRSSLTGTFSGSFGNSAANRRYPFTFVISAANTWEQKNVTLTLDTTGTWLIDNGIGLSLIFDLGSGATNKGVAGAWTPSSHIGVTGAVNLVATAAATLYLTGVQLEVGEIATPFEHRSYGVELALCQRYFYRISPNAANQPIAQGVVWTANTVYSTLHYPVPMRSIPSFGVGTASSDFTILAASSTYSGTGVSQGNSTNVLGEVVFQIGTSSLRAGDSAWIRTTGTAGYIHFHAEI